MLSLAVGLMVAGVTLVAGSFIFALLNMANMSSGKQVFKTGFAKHAHSMIGMFVGMLLACIGFWMGAVDLLEPWLRQLFHG